MDWLVITQATFDPAIIVKAELWVRTGCQTTHTHTFHSHILTFPVCQVSYTVSSHMAEYPTNFTPCCLLDRHSNTSCTREFAQWQQKKGFLQTQPAVLTDANWQSSETFARHGDATHFWSALEGRGFGHRFSQDGSSACLISLSLLDVTFDFVTMGDTLRRRAQNMGMFRGFWSSRKIILINK